MNTTTVAVDLAKSRFEIAIADEHYQIQQRKRLSRSQFARFVALQPPSRFVMEACGSAQHWGRELAKHGHEVRLLPAQHVRAYVKRNKTDAADAAGLVEASRCADIRPVPIKTLQQQTAQQLHRLREQYKRTRNQRINLARGCLRECGLVIAKGIGRGIAGIREALEHADNGVPDALRPWLAELLEEIGYLKQQQARIERQLAELVREDDLVGRWLKVPGVGLLGASAARASTGEFTRFPTGRHFASSLGLTAREHSSGERRRLGAITKQGDRYLRTLFVHGARSALTAARRAEQAGRPLDDLRRWALDVERRRGTNKATVALANKMARILWAMAVYDRRFNGNWHRQAQPTENVAA
jgi:transposase